MKVLLLCPSQYSLDKTIKLGFERLGYNVYHHDFRYYLKNWHQKLNTQIFRFPNKYREIWESYYFPIINKRHLTVFDEFKPDIVFIYNNEALLPATINYFKSKNAKIVFFLGDSPYYTPSNKYYLHLLPNADLIISPDSMWAEQLKLLGIKNIVVDFPGFDDTLLKFREPNKEEREKYNFDLFFVGTGYVDAWGYKRAMFAGKFAKLNIRVLGTKHWVKWLEFFPELKTKFELIESRISFEQLVIMSKCAKVYPVDANPAILNGVHLRVFDCIATGVLPLVEYRKDHDIFFNGIDLPLIKNYNEAESLAKKYIKDDTLRENTLQRLTNFTLQKFSPQTVIKRILEKI